MPVQMGLLVMERLKDKIFYSALGASGGLAGLVSLSKCQGNACTSCFGCAGVGVGILLITLIKKFKGGVKNNGMA